MVPVQFYSNHRTFHLLHTFVDRAFLFPDQIHKGNAMLLLQDVKPQDNGTYECQIYTKNGTKTYLINVNVNAPVSAVSLDLVDSGLVCSSEGVYPVPTLSWSPPIKQPNITVSATENQLYSISSFLKLSDFTPHLEYRCNVSTGYSWRSATFTLHPPVLFSGSETTIHCAGPNHLSPIVSLEWTFNHTQTILNQSTETQSYTVSETWRQKVKNVSANGSLTLNYVTPDQQGLYTCHLTTDNETYMTDTLLEIHGFSTTVAVILLSILVIVTGLVLCCIYKWDKKQLSSSSPETPQSPSEPDVCTSSQPSDQNNLMVKFLVFILGLGSLLPWHIYVTASLYVHRWCNTSLWIFTISLFTLLHPLLRLMAPNMFSSFYLRFPLKINIITWSLGLIPLPFSLVAAFIKAALDETTFFCFTVVIIWLSMFFSASLQHLNLLPEYHSVFAQGQAAAGTSAALIMLFSIAITNSFDSAACYHFLCAGLESLVIAISYFGLSYQTRGQVYLKNSRNSEEPSSVRLLGQDNEQNNVNKTIIQNENKQEIQKENEQNENVQNEMQKENVQNIKSLTSVFLFLKNIRFKALYVIAVPAVTLSVFPAITADVTTVFTGQWERFFPPVCCFLNFNIFDLIGSVITAQGSWSFENFRFRLLFPVFVFIRAGFIPLLMFCNVQPRRTFLPVNPFLSHDVAFVVIMSFFSLSHGCLRCLSMSYALHTGKDIDTDTAVVLIRLLWGLGLTLGAALSFAFRS